MFQASIRGLAPTTRRQCGEVFSASSCSNHRHHLILPSVFRHFSSAQVTSFSTLRSIPKDNAAFSACGLLHHGNSLVYHGRGMNVSSATCIWLNHNQQRRRWFSDEKPGTSPKKENEDPGRLSQIVPALRHRVTHFNTGDLMSVYGIVILILIMVFSPFVASQMRKSDNQYEDMETDDPVAHTEKNFRRLLRDAQYEANILEVLWRGAEAKPRKPRVVTTTLDLVTEVLTSEELQSAISHLLSSVLQSDEFQHACQMLIKNLWHDLVNDPETIEQVVQLLHNALQNKEIHGSIQKLVFQIINDQEVYDQLTKLLVRLGQDKEVLKATQSLLTESAHNALNDPEILDHSMEFATDVVGDDVVQRTSGEALRNTVTYAVRPGLSTFLSLVGAALFLFGLSALANARASDQEAAIVEKAMSTVARNIQTTAYEGISTLLSLPSRLLSACVSVLSAVITFPLKLIQRGASIIGESGDVAFRAIATFTSAVINFPLKVIQKGISFLGRSSDACLRVITGAMQYVVRLPGAFFRTSMSSISRASQSTAQVASRALNFLLGTVSAVCIGAGSAVTSKLTSCLTAIAQGGMNIVSSMISGIMKVVEKGDRWIERTYDSIALSSSFAVHAVMNSVNSMSESSVDVVAQASDTAVRWLTKLLDFMTKGGGNDATSSSA